MIPNLKTRSITGVLIFLVTVGFVALRYLSTSFFDAFVLLVTFGAVLEVTNLPKTSKYINSTFYSIMSVCFIYVCLFVNFFAHSNYMALLLELCAVLLVLIVSVVFELFYLAKFDAINEQVPPSELFATTKQTMLTILYPTLLLSSLYGINRFSVPLGTVGLIMAFGISMFTDVFAYLFGCMIRGKKLVPQVSPKKSISGAVFGLVGGLAFAGLALWLLYFKNILNVRYTIDTLRACLLFLGSGLIGALLTQVGDLISSSIKRGHVVKDFGNIFPGHGGVMDRVDGLMFCATLIYILFIIVF